MKRSEYTLAEALRTVDYRTGIFGKWHLGNPGYERANPPRRRPRFHPDQHGFDWFFGIPYSNDIGVPDPQGRLRVPLYDDDAVELVDDADQASLTRRFTEAAIRFLDAGTDPNQPFLLYFPHSAPHRPFHVEEAFRGSSRAGAYGDVVQQTDHYVGQLLDALDERGLTDNTLVLLTSDNGPWYSGSTGGLRGAKSEAYEGGVRVPLMARWPGRVPVREEDRGAVSFLDVVPTLIALTGAQPPPSDGRTIDGTDLSGVLFGGAAPPNDRELYFFDDERKSPDWAGRHLGAVRRGDWKLFPDSRGSLPRPMDRPWLFDLASDPRAVRRVGAPPGSARRAATHRPGVLRPRDRTAPRPISPAWRAVHTRR